MFLQFYGLREQPFGVTPNPRYYYATPAHREALASLICSVENELGFAALIAEPGMGKTTLLFDLLQRYRECANTAFVFHTQCTGRELIRHIADEFGISSTDDNTIVLQRAIRSFITEHQNSKRILVVIDEAQNLPDSALEAVRLLSDFETVERKLLQIILAGQPRLATKLASADLEQLRQRITIFSSLRHLTRFECRDYVLHRLSVAGQGQAAIFTDDAIGLIADAGRGVPREINRICLNALLLGCALQQKPIGTGVIREVLADLTLSSGAAVREDHLDRFAHVEEAQSEERHPAQAIREEEAAGVYQSFVAFTGTYGALSWSNKSSLFSPFSVASQPQRKRERWDADRVGPSARANVAATIHDRVAVGIERIEVEPEKMESSSSATAVAPDVATVFDPTRAPQPKHSPRTTVTTASAGRSRGAHQKPRRRYRAALLIAVGALLFTGVGLLTPQLHLGSRGVGTISTSTLSSASTSALSSAPVMSLRSAIPHQAASNNSTAPDAGSSLVSAARPESKLDLNIAPRATAKVEQGAKERQPRTSGRVPIKAIAPPAKDLTSQDADGPPSIAAIPSVASAPPSLWQRTSPVVPALSVGKRVTAVVERKPIYKPLPVYPPAVRKLGVEGDVVLHAIVDERGRVKRVDVSSGNASLARAAVTAVRQWRYTPSDTPGLMEAKIVMKFVLGQEKAGAPQ
ncbi:MAG: TonB family protein [Terriglobales bacterium]